MAQIGIDLGTTNSVIGWSKDGRSAQVITNRENERGTPSVVGRHPRQGGLLVGKQAIAFAPADPGNTIFSVKRLMGRRYSDKEVEKVRSHVSYRVVEPPNGAGDMAHVMIGDNAYSPIEVSALILEKLKTDAESAIGEKVTHAVITVPAYFDDNQKEATRQAGGLAGLKVSRIVEEPTAAAYAFGIDQDPNESNYILVYDLGGGTFDISMIYLANGLPRVERIKGDNWLGGDNFDDMILDYVLKKVAREKDVPEKEMRGDSKFMWELKQQAETAKKTLGGAPSADITSFGKFKSIDVEVVIERAEFEAMITEAVNETMNLVEKTMDEAGVPSDDIDKVLLVGGSTAIPMVRSRLAKRFGQEKIRSTVDPMEGVALGASVLASRTEKKFCIHNHENEPDANTCVETVEGVVCGLNLADAPTRVKCSSCGALNDMRAVECDKCHKPIVQGAGGVTAKPYGVGIEDDKFQIIIPTGTRYPTPSSVARTFYTVADNQEWIIFPILQGENTIASQNELQCRIVIPDPKDGPIPEGRRVPAGAPIDIAFNLSENGTLGVNVKGKDALSWLKVDRVIQPWEKTNEAIAAEPGGKACKHCGHSNAKDRRVCESCGEPLETRSGGDERPEWRRDLDYPLMLARIAVQEYDWVIGAEDVRILQKLIDRGDKAVEDNDEAAGRAVTAELEPEFEKRCGGLFDLIIASLLVRVQSGEMDQRQKLASLLVEFKQRAIGGENAKSAGMQELRNVKIKGLVDAIMNATGSIEGGVTCQRCGQVRPPVSQATPACPNCGFDPTKIRV